MRKKSYSIRFERVGTDEQAVAIVKKLARQAIQNSLDKHGAIANNLDEILDRYITVESLPK